MSNEYPVSNMIDARLDSLVTVYATPYEVTPRKQRFQKVLDYLIELNAPHFRCILEQDGSLFRAERAALAYIQQPHYDHLLRNQGNEMIFNGYLYSDKDGRILQIHAFGDKNICTKGYRPPKRIDLKI